MASVNTALTIRFFIDVFMWLSSRQRKYGTNQGTVVKRLASAAPKFRDRTSG